MPRIALILIMSLLSIFAAGCQDRNHTEARHCVIGVHPDGSSDRYCGDPAILPANTRLAQ